MRAIVFSGPSLNPAVAPYVAGMEWRPPVRQGDVYRAALSRPDIIAIVDGYFEVTPTVWHKEILWAMAQGIHVYGAASIGALRAAELDVFGMKGVGQIYEMYRDGVLQDDDEVAVLHGPEYLGYPKLTEPMVNVRAAVQRAEVRGLITHSVSQTLVRLAKSIFFKQRTYDRVLEVAASTGIDSAALRQFAVFLRDERPDQKLFDGQALMRVIKKDVADLVPLRVSYEFQATAAWELVVQGHANAGDV
jgi:hypothetical protein